jgi:hypothetical protein
VGTVVAVLAAFRFAAHRHPVSLPVTRSHCHLIFPTMSRAVPLDGESPPIVAVRHVVRHWILQGSHGQRLTDEPSKSPTQEGLQNNASIRVSTEW